MVSVHTPTLLDIVYSVNLVHNLLFGQRKCSFSSSLLLFGGKSGHFGMDFSILPTDLEAVCVLCLYSRLSVYLFVIKMSKKQTMGWLELVDRQFLAQRSMD